MMRTADSVTPALTGGGVLASLLFYVVVYLVMYPTGLVYMAALVRQGLRQPDAEMAPIESGRPRTPFVTTPRRAAGPEVSPQ